MDMKQLIIVIFVFIVSLASLGIISFSFDPFQATGYIIFLFYLSLFTTSWSLMTILIFRLGHRAQDRFEQAFKKGFLISVAISGIFLGIRIIFSIK